MDKGFLYYADSANEAIARVREILADPGARGNALTSRTAASLASRAWEQLQSTSNDVAGDSKPVPY